MLFKNLALHNVEVLLPTPEGYRMLRVPESLRQSLNEAAKRTAWDGTGVEIRFKYKDGCDKMKLTLSQPGSAACCAWVYYGSFQAGWQDTEKYIPEKPTVIVLTRPRENYDLMK